jgi:hypothetical protein
MLDLETSIDWRENLKEEILPDAFTAIPINSNSRTKVSVDEPFILDSGATIHISPDRCDFIELKPIAPRTIKGIAGSTISAVGIGKIRLHISKGTTLILDPALYVPHATVRLVSVCALATSEKLTSHFNDTGCWLTKTSGSTVVTGSLLHPKSSLYTLNLDLSLAEHAFVSTRTPDLETWHRRLGHLNIRSIVEMSDKHMVKGMHIDLSTEPAKCQHCVLGKQTKSAVPKIREGPKADKVLDVVYIDLTGPHIRSANNNQYSMNLIDDATSMVWAIPIKLKSAAISALKEWVLRVERETGRTVGIF